MRVQQAVCALTCAQAAHVGEDDTVGLPAAQLLPHLLGTEFGVEDLGVHGLLPDVDAFAAALVGVQLVLQDRG